MDTVQDGPYSVQRGAPLPRAALDKMFMLVLRMPPEVDHPFEFLIELGRPWCGALSVFTTRARAAEYLDNFLARCRPAPSNAEVLRIDELDREYVTEYIDAGWGIFLDPPPIPLGSPWN